MNYIKKVLKATTKEEARKEALTYKNVRSLIKEGQEYFVILNKIKKVIPVKLETKPDVENEEIEHKED